MHDRGHRAVVAVEHVRGGARVPLRELQNVPDIRGAERIERLVIVADRPQRNAIAHEVIDQLDLARIDVLVLVDQQVLVGAGDLLPEGCVGRHRLRDERHHIGEIDGTGLVQRLLIDAEILGGLDHHLVIAVDAGSESLGIQKALLGTADDVENVGVLVPVHAPGRKHTPLLGRVPELDPLG